MDVAMHYQCETYTAGYGWGISCIYTYINIYIEMNVPCTKRAPVLVIKKNKAV